MSKKNIFSGLLSVLVIAVVVFLAIYFFFPDVSMKYYGVAFNSKLATRNAMASAIAEADISETDRKAFEELLASEDADKLLDAVAEGAKSVPEALESKEAKALWEKLESSVSKDSLEGFASKAGSSLSDLYQRLFR